MLDAVGRCSFVRIGPQLIPPCPRRAAVEKWKDQMPRLPAWRERQPGADGVNRRVTCRLPRRRHDAGCYVSSPDRRGQPEIADSVTPGPGFPARPSPSCCHHRRVRTRRPCPGVSWIRDRKQPEKWGAGIRGEGVCRADTTSSYPTRCLLARARTGCARHLFPLSKVRPTCEAGCGRRW